MSLNRRTFFLATAIPALTAVAGSAMFPFGSATAQSVSPSELLQPGALGDRQQGVDTAPVTIIEYASLTCPACASFHKNTYPELRKRYIDSGKVRYIFREFALNPLDAGAMMLARCISQEKYFDFVDILFRSQPQWVVQRPIEPLRAIARQTGFSNESFETCLKNQRLLDGIEAERTRASQRFGVNATPTFFINGQKVQGVLTIEELEKHIKPHLQAG